nr:lysophospholipid acyltransferase family protein [Maliibacterium massiliense]
MKQRTSKRPLTRALCALFFYGVAMPLLYVFDALFFGLRVRGRRHLRALKKTGAVIVCNHVHYLDCTFVGIALLMRRGLYVSLEQNFHLPVAGVLIRMLGATPLPAQLKALRGFMQEMVSQVRAGRLVCIYPEGWLIPYCDHLRPFKAGPFAIAVEADAPVVPLVITPCSRRGIWRLKRKPCFIIRVGAPLYPAHTHSPRADARTLLERTREAMARMLGDQAHT